MMYIRCKIGIHNWIYLIRSRVCLRCGRADEVDKVGILHMTRLPIFRLRNPLEVEETQIILRSLNKKHQGTTEEK